MRTGIARLLSIAILLLFVCNTALAEANIAPTYAHVSSIATSISRDGSTVRCAGRLQANDGLKSSITVRLQCRPNGGKWATIHIWNDSSSIGISEAGGNKTAARDCDYRTYATGRVYGDSGAIIETVEKYSKIISY